MFKIEFDILNWIDSAEMVSLMSNFGQSDVIGREADVRSICPPKIHLIDPVRMVENRTDSHVISGTYGCCTVHLILSIAGGVYGCHGSKDGRREDVDGVHLIFDI